MKTLSSIVSIVVLLALNLSADFEGIKDPALKQMLRCEHESSVKKDNGDPNVCLKAIKMLEHIDNPSNQLAQLAMNDYEGKTGQSIYITDPGFPKVFQRYRTRLICENYLNAAVMFHFRKYTLNYFKAAQLYEEAIEKYDCGKFFSNIELNLAMLYAVGSGVHTNIAKACRLLQSAKDRGNKRAQRGLDVFCN